MTDQAEGEARPGSPPSPGAAGATMTFEGLSIFPGKAVARICLYSRRTYTTVQEMDLAGDDEVARDLGRFDAALAACSADMDRITANVARDIGKAEAEIFTAQKHIMNDASFIAAVREIVGVRRKNLEWAIATVLSDFEKRLLRLDNQYMRDRATDLGEIRRRLLDHLQDTRPGFICHGHVHCVQGRHRVIVAEEMTAEMMVHMSLDTVHGLVTERGGATSHAAIIARSVGIPSVSGVRGILRHARCGDEILVDGDAGTVVLRPDAATKTRLLVEPVPAVAAAEPRRSPPGVQVMANASMLEDVNQARGQLADGIGLFRTEIRFLREERLLGEDEQFALYREVQQVMEPWPVVFRLLDVGGDKALPFLRIEKEENPFLGWRGARFLLGNPDILGSQVRALARLARESVVRVMIPMVVDLPQLDRLVSIIRATAAEAGASREQLLVGAMFEVPSACLAARGVFERVDFGSIGSNDLQQYLFAVDRNNELVSGDCDPEHPVLWEVLESLARAATEAGKPLSICGEIAGRRGIAARLVKAGITSMSVSPRLIPRVRQELAADPGLAGRIQSQGSGI